MKLHTQVELAASITEAERAEYLASAAAATAQRQAVVSQHIMNLERTIKESLIAGYPVIRLRLDPGYPLDEIKLVLSEAGYDYDYKAPTLAQTYSSLIIYLAKVMGG